jgi:hypothetical protein
MFLERGIGQVDKHHVRSIVTVFELYISVQLRARIVVLHLILEMLKPGTIELPLPAFRKRRVGELTNTTDTRICCILPLSFPFRNICFGECAKSSLRGCSRFSRWVEIGTSPGCSEHFGRRKGERHQTSKKRVLLLELHGAEGFDLL